MLNLNYIRTNSFIYEMLYQFIYDTQDEEFIECFNVLQAKCLNFKNVVSKYISNTSFNIVNDQNEPLSFLCIVKAIDIVRRDEDYFCLGPDESLIRFIIALATTTVYNFAFKVYIDDKKNWTLDCAFNKNNPSELFYLLRNKYKEPLIEEYEIKNRAQIIYQIINYLLPQSLCEANEELKKYDYESFIKLITPLCLTDKSAKFFTVVK